MTCGVFRMRSDVLVKWLHALLAARQHKDEDAKLLDTCAGDELVDVHDRALIILALRSGLRRGGLRPLEIAAIRPPKITTIRPTPRHLLHSVNGSHACVQVASLLVPCWCVFDARAKQAKIRHVFPHLARHSTVTRLREEGKSSAEVGKLAGQTE